MFIAPTVFALVAVLMSLPPSRSPAPAAQYYGVPWRQRTLRLLLFKARLTCQAWRPVDLRARSGVQGDFRGSNLVAFHSFQGLRPCRRPRALFNKRRRAKEFLMPKEQDNKAIVGRW